MTKFTCVELGDKDGENLVFLGGWPDDSLSGWAPLFDILKSKYRILSLCIPQFESNCTDIKPWGFSFDQLVDMMNHSIQKAGFITPFTLVVHDWGCVIGMLYRQQYPENVKSMILIDVGIKGTKNVSLWDVFLILLYQWWNAWAYIVTQLLGVGAGYLVMMMFGAFFTVFPFLKVCPHDKPHRPWKEALDPHKLHLYFRYWRDYFAGNPVKPRFPACPFLYMYGKKKNVMFHDSQFLSKIDGNPVCRWLAYDCGHYPMHDCTEEMARDVEQWMQEHR